MYSQWLDGRIVTAGVEEMYDEDGTYRLFAVVCMVAGKGRGIRTMKYYFDLLDHDDNDALSGLLERFGIGPKDGKRLWGQLKSLENERVRIRNAEG